jgi:hypothetical protein
MHDEVLVRVMHCGTNDLKQLQPGHDVETIRVAEGVDGDTIDVFHDNVGRSIRQGAAVHEVRDVWMIQLRQDLALNFEPRVDPAGGRAAVHHFNGYLLLEFGIRALGKENLAHTADTQGAQYAIVSYAVSHHFRSMHPGAGEPQTSTALAVECCLRV